VEKRLLKMLLTEDEFLMG